MDPLSTFLFSLLCSAAYDGIKLYLKSQYPDHITDKISKAFDNALEKWTPNEELRENERKTLTEKIYLLKEQIERSTNLLDIDEDTQNLLELLRVELMSDTIAYHFLEELHWDKTENDLAKIKRDIQEIKTIVKPNNTSFIVNLGFYRFISKITPNQYYIPRKIQNASENVEVSGNSDLISLIEENKTTNIVVLASAGMGKTEELKQTAITLASRESKYPIFVSFSNFTADKDIEHYLPKEWINVPQEKLVLLFDGFDELIDNEIHTIQRKLGLFIENNPEITIVVSCRTNFDYVDKNGYSETLKGFTAYYLQALNYENVLNYVSAHHGINGNLFMNAVYHKQFDDLVYNPFFLQILIPDFKQNNTFTGNRTQLFQKFIKERLSWDKVHFATSYSLNDEEERALELLRKVSVAMEMLGSRNINVKDLRTLISDKSDFELIKHCTVFNKEEGFEHWKFEHNNFQEILCAEKLAELPFETVIDLISFKGYNKIQPSWTNTVSFLISLLNENDILFQPLVDWIVSNDPEILVKVEKERIPLNIRTEIFIRIFNYYKELNIWINSNRFSYSELAYFGQSENTIEFIVNEVIDIRNPKRIRLNAIHILSYFSIKDSQMQEIIKYKLLKILHEENELESDFIHAIIIAIENLGCTNKNTIEELMSVYEKRNSRYIRAAMYSLINRSKLADLYIDYYIAGIELFLNRYTIIADRESTSLGDEDFSLFEGVFELKSLKALSKFIDYYSLNYSRIEGEFQIEEHFDRLIYNCIELYNTEKCIFESMYQLLSRESSHSWMTNKQLATLLFFEETNTKEEALIKTLLLHSFDTKNNYDHIRLISCLIDEENINNVIRAYHKQLILEMDLLSIYRLLQNINQQLSEYFKTEVYKSTGVIFEIANLIDYDKIRKDRAQTSFDLLFDTELLKKECLKVFGEENVLFKNEIQLYKRNQRLENSDFIPKSVIDLLYTLTSNNTNSTNLDEVINWFDSSDNLSYFIINRIYFYLLDRNYDIIVSNEQIEYIHNWFDITVPRINFASISMSSLFGISSISFLNRFGFHCDENILLDMLSFSNSASVQIVFGFIESKIEIEKIKARVISNIKNKVVSYGSIYVKYTDFIFRNKIIEIYSNLFEDLSGNILELDIQTSIIDLYFRYNTDTTPLKKVFDCLDFDIKVLALINLVKNGDIEYSIEKLIKLHNNDLGEWNEKVINNLIISCKSIKGLEYSVQWIKKYMQSPFSQHGQSLVYFENLDSLPYFMELLELGYDKEIKIKHELDGMLSIVLEGIYYLAIQSEANFKEVCSKLKEFIETNKGKLEEVEFLNATIERIKEKFFQTHSIKFTIRQIKQQLNSLAV